ncbi:MAG: class I SAM-dependent methyltransferase [Verrucomicrobia bacterium]|nr:class I SAM-dependent methyltransferase [Verrucomicrobiota bacterium]MBS0646913.1 class I SAM-dependent methyltransferase [Verrucomicrobiota bacterium]
MTDNIATQAKKSPQDLILEDAAHKVKDTIEEQIKPYHRSYFWGDRLLTLDKSAGFLSDSLFASAYHAIQGSHQYDQYEAPHTISWRLHTLVWAAKSALSVEGDFVECGVYKADMSWVISQVVDFVAAGKNFYLYDTFAGFSEKYSSKEDFPDFPGFLDFANKYYKDPSLYSYVCERFKDFPAVKVIKGVVPDVLLERAPDKIAFLHIDLNSPAAEIGALEILFPRLSPGALLVFDDYGWKQFYKQKEAEDRFMRQHGYEILELPTGQGLVVKR